MFPIDTYFGSLWFILREDGVGSFFGCVLSSLLVRLLPFDRRVVLFEEHTVNREDAVQLITEDTASLPFVLLSLITGGVILLGRNPGRQRAHEDFVAIVRRAAFRRQSEGRDATELHLILDDIAHTKADEQE